MRIRFLTYCLISAIALLCFSPVAFAQSLSDNLEKGDKAFDALNFQDAMYFYELALDQNAGDANVTRRIANTYRRTGQMPISAEWYKRTLELGSNDPLDMLYYAESLKSLGQYDEAVLWYEKYSKKVPDDLRAKSHLNDKLYYQDLFADTLQYDLKRLAMNNADPVISVSSFDSTHYIIAAINAERKSIDKRTDFLNYLDVYMMDWNNASELVNPKRLSKAVNSKYNDGPAFYSKIDKTLYVTRNNMRRGKPVFDKDGNVNLKIYTSQYTNGNWTDATELKFNKDEYSNGHATVSADGKTMYFVSKRSDGLGGTDIYSSTRTSDGWSTPASVGTPINTEGNEMFPFAADDGKLFFSSDGHAGLGGTDIFYSEWINGSWTEPKNLGAPINSNNDDFAIFYETKSDRGFFCSNRNGQGNDDLFFYNHKPIREMVIAGRLKEAGGKNLAGARLLVVETNSGETSEIKVNGNQGFLVLARAGESIAIYMADNKGFDTSKPIATYQVPSIIRDPYSNIGVINVEAMKKQNDNSVVSGPLQIKPVANSNPLLNSSMQASVKTSVKGNAPVTDLEVLGLNNILFGYNSDLLTKEEISKLDRVEPILQERKDTRLVVRAFCDSRGSFEYNKKLSLKRAGAVKAYLVSKGVDARRISVEWFGEDNPVNNCDDLRKCSEEEYKLNRRAELIILPGK